MAVGQGGTMTVQAPSQARGALIVCRRANTGTFTDSRLVAHRTSTWPLRSRGRVPIPAPVAAIGVALVVGAMAGMYPAMRAARLTPSEALRPV